jgi:3-oxoacyl-[acyl-carrier protein] reductase
MDLGLKNLKAILAGATKGIGRATLEVLAAEGCSIAFCARNADEVQSTIAALKAKGAKAHGEVVDMTDAAAYRAWVERAAKALGGCDIFIPFASAGGGPPSEETWRKNYDLDLMATYRGIEAALPFLKQSKAGSIVAIGTTAALEEFYGPQPYNAIKAAVINYAAAMSQQLASAGVRVNTVSPGPTFIEGGSWDMVRTHMRAIYDETLAKMPIGRMCTAEEVANAIAFVASPACRAMTGTNIVVDGGYTRRVQY